MCQNIRKNICVQQKILKKKLFNRVVSKNEIKSIHNLKGFDDFRFISNHFFLFCKSLNNLNWVDEKKDKYGNVNST